MSIQGGSVTLNVENEDGTTKKVMASYRSFFQWRVEEAQGGPSTSQH